MTCFAPGTMIATPDGTRPVEDLRAGDSILTRDNGVQRLVWAERRHFDRADLARAPHLWPVRFAQGSLDAHLPEADMLVAPNQRILVPSDRTMLPFEEHEALVAAKYLENCRSIRAVRGLGVTYVHVMCARHELALANGCWCELFQPDDPSLNGLGNAQRNELSEIFPCLSPAFRQDGRGPVGRRH